MCPYRQVRTWASRRSSTNGLARRALDPSVPPVPHKRHPNGHTYMFLESLTLNETPPRKRKVSSTSGFVL
jgi:hypothetical protein